MVAGFLTIGVPNVKRQNGMQYLLRTIDSLILHISADDKKTVVVMVFLADFDRKYNDEVAKAVTEKFLDYINMGFLQVVQVSKQYYPKLDNLKRNFGDKPNRVKWRSKQVADFAFMFLYSQNISKYYLQIEDDVISANNFVTAIRDYIRVQKKQWALLEFSELGFIGKLFKSKDLWKLAQYMLTFYDEQPIDWLIRYFRMSMAQGDVRMRKPTLFQHMGLTSSFDTSKQNKLRDKYFDGGTQVKSVKGDQPSATVITNLTVYDRYTADLAYTSASGYFWAKDPHKGDLIQVIFTQPVRLRRIYIESGTEQHSGDVIKHGQLEVSATLDHMGDNTALCSNTTNLGKFSERLDVDHLENKISTTVKCLTVSLTETQKEWLIVNQIAVFVMK